MQNVAPAMRDRPGVLQRPAEPGVWNFGHDPVVSDLIRRVLLMFDYGCFL